MKNLTQLRTASSATAAKLRSKLAAGAAAVAALGYSVAASAQSGFGTTVKTEIESGKSELWLIGGAILILCVVTALVNRGKSVTK